MKKSTGKKYIAVALILALALSTCTAFTYQDGFGTVYYESHAKIFDGVTYTEQIGSHSVNGIEHAHMVEAKLEQNNIMPIVFNGEVRGTYTVADMITYAEEQGYKVVAAINGDIFDMATGTTKNPTIHDGNLITSGYQQDRVITFDYDNKASVKAANLVYGLKGTINTTQVQTQQLATDGAVASDGAIASGGAVVPPVQPQTVVVPQEFTSGIDYFNVQYGALKGLHLYNRHYAPTTKTAGSCVEVVIDADPGTGFQLQVNKTIKGTVKSVNPNTANTAIGENQLVLSTVAGSASSATLAQMVVGSQVEISVRDNGNTGMENVKEALGLYYSIVENGSVVTTGTEPNPRTGLGIKSDGSVVLYEVDGRQAVVSKGLSLSDMAKHMISMGCTNAYNLDGGGSSVLYSRLPGQEYSATLKSSPSGGAQRKVANALLLVYKDKGGSAPANLHLYPALSLVMPGAEVQLDTFASNNLYEKVSLPAKVDYSVDASYGVISPGGLFTAGENLGRVEINASSGEMKGKTEVEIVDDITFTPSVQKLYIEAGKQAEIDVAAKVGTMKVRSKDSLFTWSCDENVGTIDQNGLFVAGGKIAQQGNVYVDYKGKKVTIPVQVGPMTIDFSDTYGHWAKDYIGSLAARGILDGIGNNMFAPDSNVTRAQFLAMLAKTVYGLDISKSQPTKFTDVVSTEWYYNYVNWGYENGIVNGISETNFAPNNNITREQMTIMICNFARSLAFMIPQNGKAPTFSDVNSISPWAADYVATVAGAGIINGQPDGAFQPQGNATRAQAAKVLYVFSNLKDGIE